MSVRADTVLMDYRTPIGPEPEDRFTLLIGTKETKAAYFARSRSTWISADAYQWLAVIVGKAADYVWETSAEALPPEILERGEIVEGSGGRDTTESPNIEDDENTRRLKLLARKYARKGLTSEEQARLEIVSERVRRLIPRVTAEDFERLEALAEEVRHLRELDEEVRHKMGLLD